MLSVYNLLKNIYYSVCKVGQFREGNTDNKKNLQEICGSDGTGIKGRPQYFKIRPRTLAFKKDLTITQQEITEMLSTAHKKHTRWKIKRILKEAGIKASDGFIDQYVPQSAGPPTWALEESTPLRERYIWVTQYIRGLEVIEAKRSRRYRKPKQLQIETSEMTLAELKKLHTKLKLDLSNLDCFSSSESEQDVPMIKTLKSQVILPKNEDSHTSDESNTTDMGLIYNRAIIIFITLASNLVLQNISNRKIDDNCFDTENYKAGYQDRLVGYNSKCDNAEEPEKKINYENIGINLPFSEDPNHYLNTFMISLSEQVIYRTKWQEIIIKGNFRSRDAKKMQEEQKVIERRRVCRKRRMKQYGSSFSNQDLKINTEDRELFLPIISFPSFKDSISDSEMNSTEEKLHWSDSKVSVTKHSVPNNISFEVPFSYTRYFDGKKSNKMNPEEIKYDGFYNYNLKSHSHITKHVREYELTYYNMID